MNKLESRVRKILSEITEAEPVKVKNKNTEEIRKIAQSLSAAKQILKSIQADFPPESGAETIIQNTIQQLSQTQKTFLGITKFI
jgi:hypothetical protein